MSRYLDDEALGRFEIALRDVGASITRVWRPGLDDEQIDELVAPHGIDLPEEARRWWRWHDGFAPGTRAPKWDLTPGRPLFDLETTLELFDGSRDEVLELEGADARLQPVGEQPWIFFDCSGSRDAPVPVFVGGHGESHRRVLDSIGELVAVWTKLIETGAYITDGKGSWKWDFNRIPVDVQRLGVY